MDDVMIIGFDTCDDTSNSPRAVLQKVRFDCNVGEAIHANGGGMKLENANVHNFIEGVLDAGSPATDITKASWPITGITADTDGGVNARGGCGRAG